MRMTHCKQIFCYLMVLGLMSFGGLAQANIWIDENFDDGDAFGPQSDNSGTLSEGLDLYGWNFTDPIGLVLTHDGVISSDRASVGANSYLLTAGQSVTLGEPYTDQTNGAFQYLQFAASVGTVPPAGTMATLTLDLEDALGVPTPYTVFVDFVSDGLVVDLIAGESQQGLEAGTSIGQLDGSNWVYITLQLCLNTTSDDPDDVPDQVDVLYGAYVFGSSATPQVSMPIVSANGGQTRGWSLSVSDGTLYIDDLYYEGGMDQDAGWGGSGVRALRPFDTQPMTQATPTPTPTPTPTLGPTGTPTPLPTPAPPLLPDPLVHLSFEEGAGATSANDGSLGAANDAALGSLVTWTTGRVAGTGAAQTESTDNDNGHIIIPPLGLADQTGFTFACWYNLDPGNIAGDWSTIFSSRGTGPETAFMFQGMGFQSYTNGGNWTITNCTPRGVDRPAAGTWTFIAVTWAADESLIYYGPDGGSILSVNQWTQHNPPGQFMDDVFLTNISHQDRPSSLIYDEVWFFDQTLSPAQIAELSGIGLPNDNYPGVIDPIVGATAGWTDHQDTLGWSFLYDATDDDVLNDLQPLDINWLSWPDSRTMDVPGDSGAADGIWGWPSYTWWGDYMTTEVSADGDAEYIVMQYEPNLVDGVTYDATFSADYMSAFTWGPGDASGIFTVWVNETQDYQDPPIADWVWQFTENQALPTSIVAGDKLQIGMKGDFGGDGYMFLIGIDTLFILTPRPSAPAVASVDPLRNANVDTASSPLGVTVVFNQPVTGVLAGDLVATANSTAYPAEDIFMLSDTTWYFSGFTDLPSDTTATMVLSPGSIVGVNGGIAATGDTWTYYLVIGAPAAVREWMFYE